VCTAISVLVIALVNAVLLAEKNEVSLSLSFSFLASQEAFDDSHRISMRG
jgi:uncharacterized protein YsxB (DUF464 family)